MKAIPTAIRKPKGWPKVITKPKDWSMAKATD
jgi:hypothetical protein